MKTVLFVTFIVCSYIEIVRGSCLSYGHSCWGAHGKRSDQLSPPGKQSRIGIPQRWALVKFIPEKIKGNDLFMNKNEFRSQSLDGIDDDRLTRDSAQISDLPAMALNSDEDLQFRDDNKQFVSDKRSLSSQKKHRKAYIYADDDEPIDDITNNSSADDNMNNLISNRNMGFYRIMNPNIRKASAVI